LQVPAEIGRKLRPILTADPLKSKGGEQAPLGLARLVYRRARPGGAVNGGA